MQIVTVEQQQLLEFIDTCVRNGYEPTENEVVGWFESPEPREARYERRRIQMPSPQASPAARYAFNALNIPSARDLVGDAFKVPSLSALMMGQEPRPGSAMAAALGIVDGEGLMAQASSRARAAAEKAAKGVTRERYVSVLVSPAESRIAHMVRVGWLAETPIDEQEDADSEDVERRLCITPLGRALLKDARSTQVEEEPAVVSFDADDPVAYAQLVGTFGEHGAGLFADCYLTVDGLAHLRRFTSLRRFLVGAGPHRKRQLTELATYLHTNPTPTVELRQHEGFHDRIAAFDDDAVFMLGSSLNAVGGRKPTVLVRVQTPADEDQRNTYQRLWDAADPLFPEYD